MSDFVPGYEASQWYGVGAPRNTPAGIVDMLNREINSALADPRMKARLQDLGGTVLAGSPAAVRQAYRRRNRKVGQGDPGGQYQARVN